MKIKIGDLTVRQVHSICQVACTACPLHCGVGENIECMTDDQERDEYEVNIPEELLKEKK